MKEFTVSRQKLYHRIFTFLFAIILFIPLSGILADSANLYPLALKTLSGSVNNPGLGVLQKLDQSGSQDNPARYVLFKTPSVNYRGYLTFRLGATIQPSTITQLAIKLNYKGPAKRTQVWNWSLYDWNTSSWVKVGDNTLAVANVWKLLTFTVNSPLRFIHPSTREIRLQIGSGNSSANAKIDFASIQVSYAIPPVATLAPPAAGWMRFAVIGDYGQAGNAENNVALRVKSWNPAFIVTAGDNNYDSGSAASIDANIGQYYHSFIFPYTGGYGQGASENHFFPILGNHDWVAPNAQPYLDYFTLPGNERYYDFVQGPIHFFMLDSDPAEPDGITSDSIQAQWLKTGLENSTSPWQVVILHHAPYSSGLHGSNPTLQWPFAAWGADAVLAGHDHTYERLTVDGIPYFVNGLGGKSIYSPFGVPVIGSQIRYNGDYGAMLVEASDTSLVFKFINTSGSLIDTYTATKPGATLNPSLGGCPLFPADNIWNTPVDTLPVHASSNAWVDTIGRSSAFHMDFGSGTWDGGPIGIPLNIVSGAALTKSTVSFYYPEESDPGPYPIPANPQMEYGSDHHILLLDSDTCKLYEIYDASLASGQWSGGSGAIWDLNSNALRPAGWTSSDAAGLPILPGLVRYDEILAGEINHALRFTASNTAGYIWPARHLTAPASAGIPPMGARFRLKASYDISGFPANLQIILRAMKKYGIILADNGAPWYVTGAPDPRWDNDQLHLLDVLTGNDFEAVDASALMVSPDSGQAAP
jgi:hypothetical protein